MSNVANTPGNINNINIAEAIVPCDIVLHICAGIASANADTINVTIIAALAWFCTFNNIAIIGIIATNGFKK